MSYTCSFLILYLNLKDKRFSWRCLVWYEVWCDFQLNRVKLVEKEKNALEGEKNKAVDFLTLENDIFRHKSRLCQYHVWVHQHLFKTWNHIISFHFCGHSTGEVVAFICYSWFFVTGLWGVFFFFNIFLSHDLQKRVVDKEEEKKMIVEDTKELTEKNATISQEIEKMNQELKNVEK